VSRTPRGISLGFAIDVEDDLRVGVDAGDLTEILGNLLENAARFATSSVRVEGSKTDRETTIVVVDDGPGITDADKPAALLRGVKLDAGPGTGLGLAIVSDVVEAYGGRVDLADANPGLKVSITFPNG
jgi:signal transduction histidine kinase